MPIQSWLKLSWKISPKESSKTYLSVATSSNHNKCVPGILNPVSIELGSPEANLARETPACRALLVRKERRRGNSWISA